MGVLSSEILGPSVSNRHGDPLYLQYTRFDGIKRET